MLGRTLGGFGAKPAEGLFGPLLPLLGFRKRP